MKYDEAMNHCIFRYVSGSKAYGTDRPDSDTDWRGVFVAPLRYTFNLYTREDEDGAIKVGVQQIELKERDEVIYELRRVLKLLVACNPNIIECLWVDRFIDIEKPLWTKIRQHRDYFLSTKARHTFSGYAIAQLRRIRTHRAWLLNPPDHEPTRQEFGLPQHGTVPKEQRQAILSLSERFLGEEVRETVKKEQAFEEALKHWRAYCKWDRERNPERKALEAKFGYDVKHAMHLVRILRMGEEILRRGEVNVYREDRDELRSIMQGAWTYEEIEAYATGKDGEFEALEKTSPLPHSANKKAVEELFIDLCEEVYGVKIREER